jgi:hypothetical protein
LNDTSEHLRSARWQRLAQQIHDRLIDVLDRQIGDDRQHEDHRGKDRQHQVEAQHRRAVEDVVVLGFLVQPFQKLPARCGCCHLPAPT